VCAVALLAGRTFAAEDEADTFPGLLGQYRTASKSITRIDPDIAFDWAGDAPDPRLPRGPFSVRWTGQLLVRDATSFRFHAFVQGTVTVSVDGRVVLSGRRERPGWISGKPESIGFGERPIDVQFESTEKGASLRLFWSGGKFPLEPLPAHLLFSDSSAAAERKEWTQIETGRREFESHRCNRCHQRPALVSLAAPSLIHVADNWNFASIVDKLAKSADRPDAERMPVFDFDADDATAIAAFLVHDSQPAALDKSPASPDVAKDIAGGRNLVRTIGCLACHTLTESPAAAKPPNSSAPLGVAGPFGGGDLSRVASRRTPDWLWTWLARPEALNPDHRMPVFNLSQNERRQIVAYLATLKEKGTAPAATAPAADNRRLERGRQLVTEARCAACHRIKDVTADVTHLPDLSQPIKNWNESCLGAGPNRSRQRPAFPHIDRASVIAYVNTHAGPLVEETTMLRGDRLFERKNCAACHSRGSQAGLAALAPVLARGDANLRGRAEILVPPNLTAVGDKLTDDALLEALNGGMKKRRLSWLAVRMPRFEHSDAERQSLQAVFIAHDRIPDHAPDSIEATAEQSTSPQPAKLKGEQLILAGQKLVGVRGFSCVACHEMGKFVPKNVSIPTHGSNLVGLGKRMRREFFLRWTRSPLRIRPGMEMPSYERPVAELFDDKLELQLAALWDALNERRFQPPADPSSVEQFLVVGPGEPARIVRDVFENRTGQGGPVARALAIGFNNGNSLLYDLDRCCVRGWTVGDFASQRTSGKSWYWDLAGLPVASGFDPSPEFVLIAKDSTDAKRLAPKLERGVVGHLREYRRHGDGVELAYRLEFEIAGKTQALDLRQTITPLAQGGFKRHVEIVRPIAGYDVCWRLDRPKSLIEGAGFKAAGIKFDAARALLRLTLESGSSKNDVEYFAPAVPAKTPVEQRAATKSLPETVDSVPGFDGVRLPLEPSIMPTAIAWTSDGTLAFTSLKGHVYLARDTDGDGIEDRLSVFEEGLAAPYGLIPDGRDLIVAHKPELLRLRDTDGDGRADERSVLATGWGYTENYHDWTCGIVRDANGSLYVGLGSDYTHKKRPAEVSRWRGKVLRITPSGEVTPIAHALRYPTGLAIDALGRLFVTDNQGHQNAFNEINFVAEGRHYGVPSLHEEDRDAPTMPPAIQVPHPWTRSVNGICFLPQTAAFGPLAGHGIGCEYNGRFLVRFTVQDVDGTVQGAVYPLSKPPEDDRPKANAAQSAPSRSHDFIGPLCCAVSPRGDLFIGGIQDSGWLGGANVGEIVRLRPNGKLTNGLREIRATPDGLELSFFAPVDRTLAERPSSYTIAGYSRVWEGGYATHDSGRHRIAIRTIEITDDARTVRLHTQRLREGSVYEVSCSDVGSGSLKKIWPATGYYTLHRIPRPQPATAAASR